MNMHLKRAGLAGIVTIGLVLAACGGDEGDDGGDGGEETTGTTEEETDGTAEGGAFPAVVETKFGDVTIEEAPETVVALGWGDAETALALGVQPAGASDWLGFGGDGVGPWAEGLYDESPEIIDTLEPSYEAIAALEPDLILDVKSSGDEERYERLSSIATTVGVPEGGDNWLASTEEQMTMISTALGVPDEGQALLDEMDAALEATAAEHPEWEGQNIVVATKTSEGWGAYIEGDARVDFLRELGFEQSPTIAELDVSAIGFTVDISPEQLALLDADILVAFPIFIPTEEITEDPVFQAVPAVDEGRSIVIDGELSSAYSLATTLAMQYALDGIVPLLEEVTQ